MARDLRLEFEGALYHITARGNERRTIFRDDEDRRRFLLRLEEEVAQDRWRCHAYCLMDNHYHLLVETLEPNLARGMRRLNSIYARLFNRRHDRVGHLFQGRYHAVVVDKETYLLAVSRYIVLNPVRAGMVPAVEDWAWSSYRATAGLEPAPAFLDVGWVLAALSVDPVDARAAYRRLVASGDERSPLAQVRDRMWLGSEAFRRRMKDRLEGRPAEALPRNQREPLRPTKEQIIADVLSAYRMTEKELWSRRDLDAFRAAVYLLRRVGNLPLSTVAAFAGVTPAYISIVHRRVDAGVRPRRLDKLLRGYRVRLSEARRPTEYEPSRKPIPRIQESSRVRPYSFEARSLNPYSTRRAS